MLISTPLIQVRTDYQCDDCETGILLPVSQAPKLKVVGASASASQAQYLHICQQCKAEKKLDRTYPVFESIKYFDLLKTLKEHSNGR